LFFQRAVIDEEVWHGPEQTEDDALQSVLRDDRCFNKRPWPLAWCSFHAKSFKRSLEDKSPLGFSASGVLVCLDVVSFAFGRSGSDRLSQVLRLSTIGAGEFNGRVRDGIGFRLSAITTRPAKREGSKLNFCQATHPRCDLCHLLMAITLSKKSSFFLGPWPGWTWVMRAFKSNERLVPVSCTHCCASTPGLST
jgi:hypothetical protein